MKTRNLLVLPVFAAFALRVFGQPTFLYDQQSAVEGANAESAAGITPSQPFGQSFTPMFDSVGFIRLWLIEGNPGNGTGATVFVNLRSNSITGPILAASDLVFLPDGFGPPGNRGYPDFFFTNPVPVTPGVTYYFQPVIQSGDGVVAFTENTYHYSGGNAFYQGLAAPNNDLWFREGVVVPEPSSIALILLGGGIGFYVRRNLHQK